MNNKGFLIDLIQENKVFFYLFFVFLVVGGLLLGG